MGVSKISGANELHFGYEFHFRNEMNVKLLQQASLAKQSVIDAQMQNSFLLRELVTSVRLIYFQDNCTFCATFI